MVEFLKHWGVREPELSLKFCQRSCTAVKLGKSNVLTELYSLHLYNGAPCKKESCKILFVAVRSSVFIGSIKQSGYFSVANYISVTF